MPGAGVVASKVRKQRAAAQAWKDNKEGEGEVKRKDIQHINFLIILGVSDPKDRFYATNLKDKGKYFVS